MKKTTKFLSVLLIIITFFGGCGQDVPEGKKAVNLYFSNSSYDSLVIETCYLDESVFGDRVDFTIAVMKKLLEGPTNVEFRPVIPEGVTLKGVSVSKITNNTINIDLSKEYYPADKDANSVAAELLARYSIVCTLCQLDGIDKVKLFVNGKHLKSSLGKGEALGPVGKEQVMLDFPSSVDTQTEKFITLYFTDKKGESLYPETRKATMSDNSIEKTVVNELIRGPVSAKYVQTIPDSVGITSIETTEGVCFVNLTSSFTSKIKGGSQEEKLAVYSIVNSLTCIPEIEKVQILIDGKKPEKDPNQLYSAPLERNLKIIVDQK